ncbi:MAG: hypothetical protein QXE81_04505 [Desulfurococcaceae archaeon]
MKRIAVIPFASRLHGESYYQSIYELFKSQMNSIGYTNLEYSQVVTSREEVEKIVDKYRDYIPIFLPLTGGTSSLMYEFATRASYKSVLMFSHGEHNSLAAAIAARSRVESEGIGVHIFHCREIGSPDCIIELDHLVRVLSALSQVLGAKILLITPEGVKTPEVELYEDVFDSTVDVVGFDNIYPRLEEVGAEDIDYFMKAMSSVESTISIDKLHSVAKIYGLFKELAKSGNYTAMGIDCFPFLIKYKVTPCLALSILNSEGIVTACEGDLSALALMLISKALTNSSGWISNTTSFQGRYAYFSHCTIALNMVKKPRVTTHFESGLPYGITGELSAGVYTFASLSEDYSAISTGVGRLIQSGLLSEKMCRTQVVLELDQSAESIPRYAVANHHVLIPGDVRKELKIIAWLLGMSYYDYSEAK